MRLTRQSVEALAVPPGKDRAFFWDDALKGFGAKLGAGGSRQWVVQYRLPTGATKRLTIGRHDTLSVDEARKQARNILAQVQTGGDPHAAKAARKVQDALTLESVATSYLVHAEAKLKPSTYSQVERHLRKNWLPLASLPLKEIKRANVAAHLTKLSETGRRVNANRARSALSALFAWAIGEGIADENPVTGTNKPIEERSRERVLTEDELKAIWQNLRDDAYSRIVKLLLLTAQRRTEVGSLLEGELDLIACMWTIPGSRTKNGTTHEVPLSRLALEVLAEQPRIEGRSLVFGDGEGGFSGWSKAKGRLDKRLTDAGFEIPTWTLHDLRRTAATMMADRLTVQPHVIEAILNHQSGHRSGVAGIYNRASYRSEKRNALDAWAAYVQELMKDSAPSRSIHSFKES